MRTTQLAHFFHGFLAGVLALLWSLWVALFLYVQFVLYELVEETKVRDEMYRELKEWSFGFAIGLVLAFIVVLVI